METYHLIDLLKAQAAANKSYHEFIRVPDMSVGIYRLNAGEADPQQPHQEDEVYYIISGKGQVHVDGADQAIRAGSVIYVAKSLKHYFHTIEEDLVILVVFAPAESL